MHNKVIQHRDALKIADMDPYMWQYCTVSAHKASFLELERREGTCSACNRRKPIVIRMLAYDECGCSSNVPAVELHLGRNCGQRLAAARELTNWFNSNTREVDPMAGHQWAELMQQYAEAL